MEGVLSLMTCGAITSVREMEMVIEPVLKVAQGEAAKAPLLKPQTVARPISSPTGWDIPNFMNVS